MKQVILTIFTVSLLLASMNCSSTGGNRRTGSPIVTRVKDLPENVGKRVTLVGTARPAALDADPSIQLRDGRVVLPAYEWPGGFSGKSVTIMGTLAKPLTQYGPYRLGDIELADTWSR